jgi:hypothetical protein
MATAGIEAVYVETHNWGTAARFFQTLGFELDFATDHNSGLLRKGDGPYVFVAEIPESEPLGLQVVVNISATFHLDATVEVVTPSEETHYGSREMVVRDPDGRLWTLRAPNDSPTAQESVNHA